MTARAGSADDSIEVHNAILGALAAVPVVREMVLREAAGVAAAVVNLGREHFEAHGDAGRGGIFAAQIASDIERAILALTEKEDTGR